MRLFVLLENACHDLDLRAHTQAIDDHGPSYRRYADALQKLTQSKDEELALRDGLQLLQQLLTHGLVSGVFTASDPNFLAAAANIQSTQTRIQQLVSGRLKWLCLC